MDTDQRIKAILIGDSKVGKTAIVTKITMDIFLEEELITDIGFDFKVKEVDFDDIQYKIYFWDIKQIQSRLLQSYLKNANIIIMVYDVGNRNSFNSLSHYYDIMKNSYKDLKEKVLFLIAAKNDREFNLAKLQDKNYLTNIGVNEQDIKLLLDDEELRNALYDNSEAVKNNTDSIISNIQSNITSDTSTEAYGFITDEVSSEY